MRLAFIFHLLAGKSYKGSATSQADGFLVNTESAFIYVLEGGFALLAANLLSLWYFSSKVKPESVLRIIRSIVSLGSMASQRSGFTGTEGGSRGSGFEGDSRKSISNSTLSQSGRAPSARGGFETIALSGMEPRDIESGYNAADESKETLSAKQNVQNK